METNEKASEEHTKSSQQGGPEVQEAPQLQFKRSDNFETLYANNVRYESSVWDLKLLFGVLEQNSVSQGIAGADVVELNTAMSMSWPAVKIMAYYLQLNIALHELENGKIRVNPRVYPTEPSPLAPEFQNNETVKAGRELSARMREEFIKDQQT